MEKPYDDNKPVKGLVSLVITTLAFFRSVYLLDSLFLCVELLCLELQVKEE